MTGEIMPRRVRVPALFAAAGCFVLSAFFRYAVLGYLTFSMCFFAAGAVILLYVFLPRRMRIALTVLLCIAALLFLSALIPVILASGGDPDTAPDCIIVLGAAVIGHTPSMSLAERLGAALAYLDAHPAAICVVSGGQGIGEVTSEASVMAQWLMDRGVDAQRLIVEDRAESTLENLSYSFALIPEALRGSVGVVSSEYHLYRAEFLAERIGEHVTGIPARTAYPFLRINYYIREALGVLYYRVFGV